MNEKINGLLHTRVKLGAALIVGVVALVSMVLNVWLYAESNAYADHAMEDEIHMSYRELTEEFATSKEFERLERNLEKGFAELKKLINQQNKQ